MLAAEHPDGTSSPGIVHHLLSRHLAWRTGHPFALYAMVASEKDVAGMHQLGMERLLNQRHLYRQRLQPSQRAFRLAQVIYLLLNDRNHLLICRNYHKTSIIL